MRETKGGRPGLWVTLAALTPTNKRHRRATRDKLTESDKQTLRTLEPLTEVLRIVVTSLAPLNSAAMPQVAKLLRDRSVAPGLSTVARVMLYDLADGIDMVTGTNTED